MLSFNVNDFEHFVNYRLAGALLKQKPIDVGEWQAQTIDEPERHFLELHNVSFEMEVPAMFVRVAEIIKPNLPWAEDHFQERVSGKPLNPPPSAKDWPFAQHAHADHINSGGKFSHTYPERFWPKHAGAEIFHVKRGIRFAYGDLSDVLMMLARNPMTRQAYLPVWFPEDTGAADGQRVPCTLGYHFQMRGHRMNVAYMIRSCDLLRHFRDDVYMAHRLVHWMTDELNVLLDGKPMIFPGRLTMHIMNLHAFEGDRWQLESMVSKAEEDQEEMVTGI